MRESVGEEEYMKARTSARTQIRDVLYREQQQLPSGSGRAPASRAADTINLDEIESDEPLLNSDGVPLSFFPPIEYDEDGRPRPARLYDVTNRDEPAEPATNAEDVSDARNDSTYRPLG